MNVGKLVRLVGGSNIANIFLEDHIKGVSAASLGRHGIQTGAYGASEVNVDENDGDDNANNSQDEYWVDVEWLINNDEEELQKVRKKVKEFIPVNVETVDECNMEGARIDGSHERGNNVAEGNKHNITDDNVDRNEDEIGFDYNVS